MAKLTEDQLNELLYEIIPQQLFHVSRTDVDSESGAKLDEIILLRILNQFPELLQYKPLDWYVENYITNYDSTYKWSDEKVIDFTNWYLNLHNIDFRFSLENKDIVDSFKNGDSFLIWQSNNNQMDKLK